MFRLHGQLRLIWSQPCLRLSQHYARAPPCCTLHNLSSSFLQHATTGVRQISTPSQRPMTIFSGIQPTGIPHLGNYLGALRQWVRLQDTSPPSTTFYYSIVDLHSLTSRTQTASERRLAKREALAALIACGLDPARSILYHQSSVPQHAELHWILSCDASVGALSRMTQWKSKLADDSPSTDTPADALDVPEQGMPKQRSTERLKLGLFSYPVLQAADVLLYAATHVPVGEDQVQHIEFARATAGVFNAAHGRTSTEKHVRQILTPPECIVSAAKRVMSLVEPGKKMSKSHVLPRSRILINDSAEIIQKKIRGAVTDSTDDVTYDPLQRPGVSNLVDMIAHLDDCSAGRQLPQEIAAEIQDMEGVSGSRLRVLKERAASVVERHLGPLRERYEGLMGEGAGKRLDDIAASGRDRALVKAEATMREVREAVGIS